MGSNVGVEDIEPGHWVAYVFALPGCFSSGNTEAQALSYVPEEVKNWFSWMNALLRRW
jgi:predicted RNase H-like HicB family nuclease